MRYPLRFVIPATLLVAGLVAATVVGISGFTLSEERNEQLVTELLHSIGSQAAADIALGLRDSEPDRIRAAMEQLEGLRGLRLGMLLDDSNRARFSTERNAVGRRYTHAEEPSVAALLQETRASGLPQFRLVDSHLYYANYVEGMLPVSFGGGRTDFVLLMEYDFETLHDRQHGAAIVNALVAGFTILGLSLLSWFLLHNALFRRMSKLVEASRKIGSGDLATPIDTDGHDEIAALARAMDRMREELGNSNERLLRVAGDLEAARSAVEKERLSLEERIAERTRDLTRANRELARAKEAAEAASRAKSAFLATVSHEIRTPMNGVLGAMELLDRSGLDESRAPLLRTAQQSARSLLTLLNDLLDMAKIEAGRLELTSAPASVESIVDQVVATHAPVAVSHSNRLTAEIDASVPPWIVADALRVQQVLGNFVSNAVKFTRNGSVAIAVSARELDDGRHDLSFTVADNGPGVEAATLNRLFRAFEQGSGEANRRATGTGLGLAISRGIAERMGGSVSLESEVGKGTVARFELPVAAAEAPRPGNGDADASGVFALPVRRAGGQAPRVLVVDDHPVNRLLQARQLEQLGAEARTAGDGADALRILEEESFDLVITDCEMPNVDGYEMTHRIRNCGQTWTNVPVVACTAHAMPEVANRCRDAGMNDVLTKPLRLADLARVLREHCAGETDDLADTGVRRILPVFDGGQVELMTGGDDDARRQMLDSLIEDNRRAIDDASAAAGSGDWESCRSLAHRSKGACRLFGAEPLAEAFAELEHWCREQPANPAHVTRALRRVSAESRRLEKDLGGAA